jgi:hypothetical protein
VGEDGVDDGTHCLHAENLHDFEFYAEGVLNLGQELSEGEGCP